MDQPWFRFVSLLLLVATVTTGCASATRTRRFSSSVFRSARHVGPGPAARGPHSDASAAGIVDRLHAAGFRFGTDGSPGALWGYLRTAHQIVAARDARGGDIIFFDTRSRPDEERACGDRVGVIERVDPDGRIVFTWAPAGQVQRGYVDPRAPLTRRDDAGEVRNSFLRTKTLGDHPGTRYFAGEMLCGVARVRGRP